MYIFNDKREKPPSGDNFKYFIPRRHPKQRIFLVYKNKTNKKGWHYVFLRKVSDGVVWGGVNEWKK